METNDTIAAICTAPGRAGLAVLRVSGSAAIEVAERVFRSGAPLTSAPTHTLHHGWAWTPPATSNAPASSNGRAGTPRASEEAPAARAEALNGPHAPQRLDEVVAAVFRAPRSYTGEDVVELSCHGGRFSAERVLVALLAAGARQAQPGEFTLRAFLNGRIDLAQAEAVADVIHAQTEGAHQVALSQLAGALSRRLERISDQLTDALAEVEARVDFAEDVGGIEVPAHVAQRIDEIRAELAAMLAGAAWGRAQRDGVRLPLAGRPNVGKSSVFNALVGEERAIVAHVPGTTRDRVSESIEIDGVVVTLSDTAGLRDTEDAIEAIGVSRTRDTLEESAAVLWVVDASVPLAAEDLSIAASLAGKRVLVALNKQDLGHEVGASAVAPLLRQVGWQAAVELSATRGDGVEPLRRAIAALIGVESARDEKAAADPSIALSNARHIDALRRAQAALDRAAQNAAAREPGELVAFELRECLEVIGEVTGRRVDDEVLDRIFGKFCIGK